MWVFSRVFIFANCHFQIFAGSNFAIGEFSYLSLVNFDTFANIILSRKNAYSKFGLRAFSIPSIAILINQIKIKLIGLQPQFVLKIL